jgi:hypothetical protein
VSRFTVDAMVERTLAAYRGELIDETAPAAPAPSRAELDECEAVTS